MITSVCLSNEEIVVIRGKASKKIIHVPSFHSAPMPEGAIINGVITNDEMIKQTLISMRKKKMLPRKNIRLIIDSNAVMVKCENVPAMPPKKLMEFVKNTFNGMVHTHGELLYDYAVIEKRNIQGKGCQILCSAVEKDTVGNYIELFKEAGISLQSINISLNCILEFVKYYPKLKNQTYILSVVDAGFLSSFLFVNGKYSYSSRSRLLCERGTPESTAEISKIISSIFQFNKSQKNEQDISCIYFCHLYHNELGLCGELSSLLNVPCMPLLNSHAIDCKRKIIRRGINLSNYPFAVGNLVRK